MKLFRSLLLISFCLSNSAFAREGGKHEDPALLAKVHALYDSGTAHYNLGEYKDALADYKEAYRFKRDPAFLYNLGQCYRQLGDAENAALTYRSFPRERPNAPNRIDIEHFIADADAVVKAKAAQASRPPVSVQPETSVKMTAPGDLTSPPPARPESRRKVPVWGWVLVGAGTAVVVGSAVGLGVGLSQSHGPETTLGTMGVQFQ